MTTSISTVDTELGPFTALVDVDGAVLASGWTSGADELLALVSPELRPGQPQWRADLGPVTTAVLAYHRGELDATDVIEVRQRSGEFLGHAWNVLRTVPAGVPISYTELAGKAGRPTAVRAAASACARNATALFVPCHRVLRGDGTLGGFRWGLSTKRRLLAHESADR